MKNQKAKWHLCELRLYLGTHNYRIYFNEGHVWTKGLWYDLTHFKNVSWLTVPLLLSFDYDKYGPLFSIEIDIGGLGFYVSVNPPWETAESKRLIKEVKCFPIKLKRKKRKTK